jgi:CBS domain-containing protein
MDKLTSRFLGQFNKIHRRFREICGAGPTSPFPSVLDQAAKRNPGAAHYRDELIELGQLRNIIVHGYRPDGPIATPCERVVRRMEHIAAMLSSPPPLGRSFRGRVALCAPDTPVSAAMKQMAAGSFSQLPVYNGTNLVGLLTTDTVARWLADCFAREGGVLDEAKVGAVLKHAEFPDNFALLGPKDSVFDAVELFRQRQDNGKRCDAILITQGAARDHTPIGIITPFDLPKLYEAIRASGRGSSHSTDDTLT